MVLKGDFHMHTAFSRDCDTPPKVMARRCAEAGLNCIAVTDHNTIRGALEVRELVDFTVIVGEEVKSTKGDIIGLFLEEEVPRGLSPMETVRNIKGQGGLVMVPHPYDMIRKGPLAPDALREVLPFVDLVETLNARTILGRDLTRCRRLAEDTAIIPVAVSDAPHLRRARLRLHRAARLRWVPSVFQRSPGPGPTRWRPLDATGTRHYSLCESKEAVFCATNRPTPVHYPRTSLFRQRAPGTGPRPGGSCIRGCAEYERRYCL